MKQLALFLLLTTPVVALAQKKQAVIHATSPTTLSPIDYKSGFRDLKLGSDISLHPEVERVGKNDETFGNPDSIFYIRPSDEMKIGEAPLKTLQYLYYKGKLEAVLIAVDGYFNRRILLEAFKAKYGEPIYDPAEENGNDGGCLWQGRLATLFLSATSDPNSGNALLLSNAIQAQHKADDKAKAAAGL